MPARRENLVPKILLRLPSQSNARLVTVLVSAISLTQSFQNDAESTQRSRYGERNEDGSSQDRVVCWKTFGQREDIDPVFFELDLDGGKRLGEFGGWVVEEPLLRDFGKGACRIPGRN
jgi:hypothetical protein